MNPEYSLSYLAKDRYLDASKRKWIKDNVRKRECVSFVTLEEAKQALDQPSRVWHRQRFPSSLSSTCSPQWHATKWRGIPRTPEDEEAMKRKMCRCGRQYADHEELEDQEFGSTRDYRMFSKDLPTDVVVEIVHTELSKHRPISYSPKQVIRLAADTEQNTLHELIDQIWHIPKSSFLVSVYGSCEDLRDVGCLSSELKNLLRVLSNPGSALLTVSLTDSVLYREALEACRVLMPQLPYAEITPVVFVPWTCLTSREKELLRSVTRSGKSVEHEEIHRQIHALDVRRKGYFLLADYGVDTDLSATHQSHSQGLESTHPSSSDADHQTLPSSTMELAKKKKLVDSHKDDVDSSTWSSDIEEDEWTEDKEQRKKTKEVIASAQVHAVDASVEQEKQAAAKLGKDNPELDSVDGPGRGKRSRRLSDLPPLLEDGEVPSDQFGVMPMEPQCPLSARSNITEDDWRSQPRGSVDRASVSSGKATASGSGAKRGNDAKNKKKYRFFNYSFPHPLRGRVEALLKNHTHDPDGQGSLIILHGGTSFVDLAAAHGAIRSGVPVIVDQSGTGATALLLAVMKTMDKEDDRASADLMAEKRHFVANQRELQKAIQQHSSKMQDFKRYEGQVFRVIKDLLTNRHMWTLYDLHDESSLAAAAVEAFIKARSEEEALIFIKKNTMRLAAEDENHPVKRAQRDFQQATMRVAMKLNRPELMDVIVEHGFVSAFEVFKNHDCIGMTHVEKQEILASDDIPYPQIKDLRCFEARECLIQRVCKLENEIDLKRKQPSAVVQRLFLHSVLNLKTELAKHFWKQAVFQDHVAHALVASHVSRYLAENVPGDQQAGAFRQQADEFENLAKGTLNDCYIQNPKKASAIVTQAADAFGLSPIKAAISFGMRSFVAHPASSDFLDALWKGEDTSGSSGSQCRPACCRPKCSPLIRFFTKPRNVCFTSTVFYLLFLTLYGHNIIFQSARRQLSPLDITLIVWTGSFLVEEFIRFLSPKGILVANFNKQAGIKIKTRLGIYFSDRWTILDLVALIFFTLGYVLQGTLPSSEAGHVILSLVYVLFFLKLLRVMTVSQTIGPMLPMIWNMLGDLVPFLIILFIFILAYGVASEALLHAGTSWHGLYLLYLPRMAFWPIFGEYELSNIDGADCENNTLWYTDSGANVLCPSNVGRHVVPVLMGLYILITNVLMLNLLIAYFK